MFSEATEIRPGVLKFAEPLFGALNVFQVLLIAAA